MNNLKNNLNNFIRDNNKFIYFTLPERVPYSYLITAENLLGMMLLNNPEDFLLYFSCAILLSSHNKAIKKEKNVNNISLKGYSFKNFIAKAIDCAIKENLDYIKFDYVYDKNNNPVIYVKLFDTQFSFHNVELTGKMKWAKMNEKEQYQKQYYEGLKMQKGAWEMFNFAINQENLSKIVLDGSGASPKEILNENITRFGSKAKVLNSISTGCFMNTNKKKKNFNKEQKCEM